MVGIGIRLIMTVFDQLAIILLGDNFPSTDNVRDIENVERIAAVEWIVDRALSC